MSVNTYETVFIAEPEIPNENVDQLVDKIKQLVSEHKGSMTGEDRWGRRRMAYPVQGFREGFYVVLNYTAEPTVVSAIEHFFNVTDSIIRNLTTKVIKKNKKFAPRRERPAGAAEAHPGRPVRHRSEAPKASPAPAPAAVPPTAGDEEKK